MIDKFEKFYLKIDKFKKFRWKKKKLKINKFKNFKNNVNKIFINEKKLKTYYNVKINLNKINNFIIFFKIEILIYIIKTRLVLLKILY